MLVGANVHCALHGLHGTTNSMGNATGGRFEGDFRHNMRQGWGLVVKANGERIRAEFEDDRLKKQEL